MPFSDDGRRVDLILSLLSIINRTTAAAPMEIFVNGASYQIRQKMKTLDTAEAFNMMYEYIDILSPKEAKHLLKKWNKSKEKRRKAIIDEAIYDGIYVNIIPIWEDEPLFYKCMKVLKKFPFLTTTTLYINKWGRKIKLLNDTWLGEMYIIKLKQSDRRGFSARSTGAVDLRGLPTRSLKSRSHLEQHSTSCIRFRILNPYAVMYRTNLTNCWKTLVGHWYYIVYYK